MLACPRRGWDVIRRVGGLEVEKNPDGLNLQVIRRVGGLEVPGAVCYSYVSVIRRVGGLEDL